MYIIKAFAVTLFGLASLCYASPLRSDIVDSVYPAESKPETRDVDTGKGGGLAPIKLTARDDNEDYDENDTDRAGLKIKTRDAGAGLKVTIRDDDENDTDPGGLKAKR